MTDQFPKDKFMSTIKIGAKGQIVLPKELRDMFGFKEGDAVLIMADKGQGIAIQPFSYVEEFWKQVNKQKDGGSK